MIEYRQHIPSFISGVEPEKYTCNTLGELLERNKKWLLDDELGNPHSLVFACGDNNTLMVSSTVDEWWLVIGFVKGIELEEFLPRYNECWVDNQQVQ